MIENWHTKYKKHCVKVKCYRLKCVYLMMNRLSKLNEETGDNHLHYASDTYKLPYNW